MKPAGALLLTEVYPPDVGGSAELFANVYGRFKHTPVSVWRDPTRHCGIIDPSGLSQHLRLAWRLRRAAGRERLVVHCGRAMPEGLNAMFARSLGGARYVCWTHGEELTIIASSREQRLLRGPVHGLCSVIFANSRNTAVMLGNLGVPSDRIVVVYPGVDADRFRPDVAGAAEWRARLARPGERILLTVGRLQTRKGHDLALRALAALGAGAPAVRYIIAGGGAERARLEALARELGVSDRVTFTGIVNSEDLPALYAAADVFVHPNRVDEGDFEGFGIVFLEAAAAGLAVIGGNSGGVPEALEDGVTGVLVSGTDADELAGVLTRLLSSDDARRTMGAAGRRRAVESFSWARAAAQVEDVHDRVANG